MSFWEKLMGKQEKPAEQASEGNMDQAPAEEMNPSVQQQEQVMSTEQEKAIEEIARPTQ